MSDHSARKALVIKNLNKSFQINGESIEVLQDINLDIDKNEFIAIIGASGCGKSTLLRIIGGLEPDYKGELYSGNQTIKRPGLERGIVFQEARLFLWLTIEKNVEFGLPDALGRKVKKKLVEEHLELVGLENFAHAYPHQLSGGMQQRASIARALVNKPDILLLDEPFGALDAFTRMNMQQEILKIWEKEKTTMILVTHDIDEAVFLADRVVLLSKRPGTIKKIVKNEIARPRRRNDYDYIQMRNEIYSEFFAEFQTDIEYFI
jgi:ABC-type nitrate/sulfonate/bicarbonate transport system, ATPase component